MIISDDFYLIFFTSISSSTSLTIINPTYLPHCCKIAKIVGLTKSLRVKSSNNLEGLLFFRIIVKLQNHIYFTILMAPLDKMPQLPNSHIADKSRQRLMNCCHIWFEGTRTPPSSIIGRNYFRPRIFERSFVWLIMPTLNMFSFQWGR